MVESDKKIPFPQANDFQKIIKILEVDNKIIIDKEKLQHILNVGSDRQISYYISACQFLGLISEYGEFTDLALNIKKSCYEDKILHLSRLIISLPVFGEVFLKKYLYNEEFDTDEIAQAISDLCGSSNSYSVCKRRASTVKKWLKWIELQKDV